MRKFNQDGESRVMGWVAFILVIIIMILSVVGLRFNPLRLGRNEARGADNVVTDNNNAMMASLPVDPWQSAICDDYNVELGAGREFPVSLLKKAEEGMARGRCTGSGCWSDRAIFIYKVLLVRTGADYRVYRIIVKKNFKPWWTATKKVCRP